MFTKYSKNTLYLVKISEYFFFTCFLTSPTGYNCMNYMYFA